MLPRFESWEVDNELLRRYDINKKQFDVMLREPTPIASRCRWCPTFATRRLRRHQRRIGLRRHHCQGCAATNQAHRVVLERPTAWMTVGESSRTRRSTNSPAGARRMGGSATQTATNGRGVTVTRASARTSQSGSSGLTDHGPHWMEPTVVCGAVGVVSRTTRVGICEGRTTHRGIFTMISASNCSYDLVSARCNFSWLSARYYSVG